MDTLTSPRALRFSIMLIVMVVLVGAVIELSNSQRGPADPNWQRIQQEKVIRVGVDASLPPFGIYTDEGPIGFDPALAEALADQMGVEVRFTLLTFDGLYDSLLLGHVDMVIAALRPDPLRMDSIRYTDTYFDAGQVLVSRSGLASLEQMDGQKLAVELASEGDLYARDFEQIEVITFFTPNEALEAVAQGEADAALVDRVSTYLYLNQHEAARDLQIADQTLVPDPYAIAVRRSDWRLHRALNQALDALQADGSLAELINIWLRALPGFS